MPEFNKNEIPEWNFIVLFNDFDDGYWDDDFETAAPEAFTALQNIKRKHGDPATYDEAMATYKKYIDVAYEFYGGKMAVEFIKETTGQYPKGIVPPPKLNKKGEKKYVAGAQYDIGKYVPTLTNDQQQAIAEEYVKDIDPEDIQFSDEKIPRNIRRRLRKDINDIRARNNARASYKDSTAQFTTDVITQIIMHSEDIINDPYRDIDDIIDDRNNGMGLKEHVKLYDKRHEYDDDDYVIVDAPVVDNDRYSYAGGMTSAYQQQIANDTYVLRIMQEHGMKAFTSKELEEMSPSRKAYYRNIFGIDAVMSEKERKKYNKQYKKQTKQYKKKMAKHTADSDRSLASLLSSRSVVNMLQEGFNEND